MPPEPAASIIVPLLNQRRDWLEQALRSALAQTVPTPLLVVTAAATQPASLTLLRELTAEFPQLQWFQRRRNGFANGINEGLRRVRTPRVGLLLSDDWLSPETIEHCLRHDADIVATGLTGYAADGREVLWRTQRDRTTFDALPTLEQKANYLGYFFLFRRDRVLAVGGVDPNIGLVGADDYDLPWTLLEQGASVAMVKRQLYHCRDHRETRLTLRPQQQQLADLRKVLLKHGLSDEECAQHMTDNARWYGVPVHVAARDPKWYEKDADKHPPNPIEP